MAQSPSIQTLLDRSHWIQRLAARLVGDPHAAEDLAQDTWVTALEHQPDPGRPLGAWVSTVLRHVPPRELEDVTRRLAQRHPDVLVPQETFEVFRVRDENRR